MSDMPNEAGFYWCKTFPYGRLTIKEIAINESGNPVVVIHRSDAVSWGNRIPDPSPVPSKLQAESEGCGDGTSVSPFGPTLKQKLDRKLEEWESSPAAEPDPQQRLDAEMDKINLERKM